jgi:hypothetical protein
MRRAAPGGPEAVAARQRAAHGDCAGALGLFDAAVRRTIEPTLRRDRGICHETLGHAFPAIEDYRTYLSALPEAPDADAIRERLASLEEQVAPPPASAPPSETTSTAQLHASLSTKSIPSEPVPNAKPLGPKAGEQERSYDYYAAEERVVDAADSSPLRRGKGWMVGPFLGVPRYLLGEGASKDSGYALGVTLRRSFGRTVSFLSELGYTNAGATGNGATFGGPLLFVGVELRIPLETFAGDQLFFGVGPGYEHFSNSSSPIAVDAWAARARLGYRHVFGPSVGFEVSLDGGPAFLQPTGAGSGDGIWFGRIGGGFAVPIAF